LLLFLILDARERVLEIEHPLRTDGEHKRKTVEAQELTRDLVAVERRERDDFSRARWK
jgi:hypothetical protein